MKKIDLQYSYPEELIATRPEEDYRTLLSTEGQISEIDRASVVELFGPNDILVLNDTKVGKRRVFTEAGLEILFVKAHSLTEWEVLFPARSFKPGVEIQLPGECKMTLQKKGLPQTVITSIPLDEFYFERYGELALPPYIQRARGDRHMSDEDRLWYQTGWANHQGSCAAPTASLHFSSKDIEKIQHRGTQVIFVTLHVGLGTFLPIKVDDLSEHKMHSEWGRIGVRELEVLNSGQADGKTIWALGTTSCRILESWAQGLLQKEDDGSVSGETDIFIQPGYQFQVVDVLMTNFHQPESTLLALVSAFAGREKVERAYQWAIDRKFRLFSYGDLSIWKS